MTAAGTFTSVDGTVFDVTNNNGRLNVRRKADGRTTSFQPDSVQYLMSDSRTHVLQFTLPDHRYRVRVAETAL